MVSTLCENLRWTLWLALRSELATQSRKGCDFCGLLRDNLSDTVAASTWGSTRVALEMRYVWGSRENPMNDCLLGLRVHVVTLSIPDTEKVNPPTLNNISLTFDILSEPGPCASWLRLETIPHRDALDATNVTVMRQHIADRRRDRMDGGRLAEESLLPARLIDLGKDPTGTWCRLVSTHAEPTSQGLGHVEYACLSYCWGDAAQAACQFKTEEHSLEERMSGFSSEDTTAVIRDAAAVCRAVGVRYLWVDALCIVQGDTADFDRESPKMSSIYNNALATICPVSSQSCLQGFLQPRDHQYFKVPFRPQAKEEVSGELSLRYTGVNHHYYYDSFPHQWLRPYEIEESAWASRAWCFQEYHSSNILIIIGAFQVHVITYEGQWTEGLWTERRYETYPSHNPRPLALSSLENQARNEGEINYFDHWTRMVPDFCQRHLSYATDKLSAISGLASWFKQRMPQDNYLAGLWERDLHRQLYWSHTVPVTNTSLRRYEPRPRHKTLDDLIFSFGRAGDTYIAPSWSWARLDEQFWFMGPMKSYHHQPEYDSVRATMELYGTDPTGRLRDASLHIRSRAVPLPNLVFRADSSWCFMDDQQGHVATCFMDWVSRGADDSNIEHGHGFHKERDLHLLLIGSDKGQWEASDRCAWGLVICAAPEIEPEAYVRVGIFESEHSEEAGLAFFRKFNSREFCLK